MFITGFSIILGLLFLLAKLKRRVMLRLLHYDVLLDMLVTIFVLYIHWQLRRGDGRDDRWPVYQHGNDVLQNACSATSKREVLSRRVLPRRLGPLAAHTRNVAI